MNETKKTESEKPDWELVAEFHQSLSVEHLPALVEALQLASRQKLYFQGPGLRVVGRGEPYEPQGASGTKVVGFLEPS